MIKPYITSIQFGFDGWMLHYAWLYHAVSFDDAVEQAVAHFNGTQQGELLSINMTDGEYIYYTAGEMKQVYY